MVQDPIRQAQLRLARVLAIARAGEDRELGRAVRERGEQLARILHGLLRLARMHASTNRAFDAPVQELCEVIADLTEMLGPVHLVCVSGQVYVNDLRLRFDLDPEHAIALGASLERHNTGGLTFNSPLDDEDVRLLFGTLAAAPAATRPRTNLQWRLDECGLSSVEVHPQYRLRDDADEDERAAVEVQETATDVVTEAFANMSSRRLPNPLPIRRAMQEVVDRTASVDLARLATEFDPDLPPFVGHTLSVAFLSVAVGRAAGFEDTTLADLAMAAVYHDVGFCCTQDGKEVEFDHHMRAGLDVLLRQRGFHPARVRRLLAVLEHHRRVDTGNRPSLYSRVIHIVDDYDILTRTLPDEVPIEAPPDALKLMAAQAGTAYDPQLLQLFINVVGQYPPGSVLRLHDNRTLRSISGVRSPETFARPLCEVVRLAGGQKPRERLLLDLAHGGRVTAVIRQQQEFW
jgi:hypothetical protein